MCVALKVGSASYRVWYWKLVYVVVNVGSVPYRVCVLEIRVFGCKYRECFLKGVCTGNWCMWL